MQNKIYESTMKMIIALALIYILIFSLEITLHALGILTTKLMDSIYVNILNTYAPCGIAIIITLYLLMKTMFPIFYINKGKTDDEQIAMKIKREEVSIFVLKTIFTKNMMIRLVNYVFFAGFTIAIAIFFFIKECKSDIWVEIFRDKTYFFVLNKIFFCITYIFGAFSIKKQTQKSETITIFCITIIIGMYTFYFTYCAIYKNDLFMIILLISILVITSLINLYSFSKKMQTKKQKEIFDAWVKTDNEIELIKEKIIEDHKKKSR